MNLFNSIRIIKTTHRIPSFQFSKPTNQFHRQISLWRIPLKHRNNQPNSRPSNRPHSLSGSNNRANYNNLQAKLKFQANNNQINKTHPQRLIRTTSLPLIRTLPISNPSRTKTNSLNKTTHTIKCRTSFRINSCRIPSCHIPTRHCRMHSLQRPSTRLPCRYQLSCHHKMVDINRSRNYCRSPWENSRNKKPPKEWWLILVCRPI
jgi:hypothetical protein